MKIKFRRTNDLWITAAEFLQAIEQGSLVKGDFTLYPDMVIDNSGNWYSIIAEGKGMRYSTIKEYSWNDLTSAAAREAQRKTEVVNIRMTEEEKRRLERIANLTGQNNTDVVCNALIMYEASIDADSCTE